VAAAGAKGTADSPCLVCGRHWGGLKMERKNLIIEAYRFVIRNSQRCGFLVRSDDEASCTVLKATDIYYKHIQVSKFQNRIAARSLGTDLGSCYLMALLYSACHSQGCYTRYVCQA
jgi:hypothetical protein